MDSDSDTGFGSNDSSENERGVKRSHSDDESRAAKKKKYPKKKPLKLHKPPTANELNHLKETENLFHSNLFRLQIEEMLKEIQLKQKHKNEITCWLNKFHDWVLKMEDSDEKYELVDQGWLKKLKMKPPVLQEPFKVKGTYQFKKPSRIEMIGSYDTGISLGPKVSIDMLVEIPASFFQKQDYLDARYHRKRAFYLCDLAHHLQFLPELVESVYFVGDDGDNLKPCLEIIPFGKINKCLTILVHLAPEKGSFKLSRFNPNKNNVRKNWFFKQDSTEVDDGCPTPFYNASILSDMTIFENHKFLSDTLKINKNIRDGIILLKVWLKQRTLDLGFGSFNGFIVAMLVSYLLQTKKLSSLMSSYQIFRNVCHYLISADWTSNGINLSTASGDNFATMSQFHEAYPVVFIDVTGFHNICYGMCPAVFHQIQQEARLALQCLNNPNVNSFQILFMTPVPFYRHYDHLIVFDNIDVLEIMVQVYSSKNTLLSHAGVMFPQYRDLLLKILKRGLGQRAQLHLKPTSKSRWKPGKKPKGHAPLVLGLNLDPEHCFSGVDKATEKEMEEFRQFWGELSELRRFKDGTITEAVVWNAANVSERRLICKQIVQNLLKRKLGLQNSDFCYFADQLNQFVPPDVEVHTLKVLNIFDDLSKQLRDLKDLPLEVVSVQGISPVFRYAEVFPCSSLLFGKNKKQEKETSKRRSINPAWEHSPKWISPIDVVLQLGASNKWPQDVEAIRRIRAAFNIKIAESFTSQFGLTCQAFQNGLELVKNGHVFRLHIVYPNEVGMLKQRIDADGLIKYRDTKESLVMEKRFIHLPKLSSALHGVYQEHSSYGPACCLVKRWVSSHLIDSFHVSEEALELLVAAIYLQPQPHNPPQQPLVAFFRFFHLIATTNWNIDCLILNINDELSSEDIVEIESTFSSQRSNLPPIFIATPYDKTKSLWTQDSPTPLVLLRLVQLCAGVLEHFESQVYTKQFLQDQMIFEPSFDAYDVLIRLNLNFNPRKDEPTEKEDRHVPSNPSMVPINGFDPVACYLKELRENYEEMALFFHDTFGGSVIGVLWKPTNLGPRDFKFSNFPGRKLNQTTGQLHFNKEAVTRDFFYMGKDLVESIDVKAGDKFTQLELK